MVEELFIPENDIRSNTNPNSLVRRIYNSLDTVNLDDVVADFSYDDYKMNYFNFQHNNDNNNIIEADYSQREEHIKPLIEILFRKGYGSKIGGAITEAIRNADKHGNKLSNNKEIGLGYKFSKTKAEIIIEDTGEEIEANFLPYSQYAFDNLKERQNFQSYYNFTETTPKKGHSGIGTLTMHMLADEVTYHKSPKLGGLLVRLVLYK